MAAVLLRLLLLPTTAALVLSDGQRISPRPRVWTESAKTTPVPPTTSLFDLQAVEDWAGQQGMKQHHLKVIYKVLMRGGGFGADLEERLIEAKGPTKLPKKFLPQLAKRRSQEKAVASGKGRLRSQEAGQRPWRRSQSLEKSRRQQLARLALRLIRPSTTTKKESW